MSLKEIGQETGLDAGTLTPSSSGWRARAGWRAPSPARTSGKMHQPDRGGRQLQQEVRECCLADNLRNQVDLADAELAQLKVLCDRVSAQLGR